MYRRCAVENLPFHENIIGYLSDTETLIGRLLDILAGISRIIRHCVLHDTSFYAMRSCEDNFQIPIAFTSKKKRIGRFEGLPQFKWTDLGGQDVIGQGSFGAVFVTEYTRKKDGDSARKGETVVVKKLLGSSLDFIDAFAKEARLLYVLKHDNIVGFRAVCHDPVAFMPEYVYFDLSVFGGEGQVSSLKDFLEDSPF